MKNYVTALFLLFSLTIQAQKTLKIPLRKYKVATLSDSLSETSGLTFLQNRLFTLNDEGNPNLIFEIDKNSGKIKQKIKTNFANKDWEAITNDETNFYIGDIGNNAGNRKDLSIYQYKNSDSFKKIEFNYTHQKDYSPKYLHHDFDAEAMIFLHQKIHLFTKEWASKSISHYIICPEKATAIQSLEKTETQKIGFVTTDAAYYNGHLYIVGYTKTAKVYLMIFEEDFNGIFFSKPSQKYYLGSAFKVGQVEGIAVSEDGVYISNERFNRLIFNIKPSLYRIPLDLFKK